MNTRFSHYGRPENIWNTSVSQPYPSGIVGKVKPLPDMLYKKSVRYPGKLLEIEDLVSTTQQKGIAMDGKAQADNPQLFMLTRVGLTWSINILYTALEILFYTWTPSSVSS